MLNEVLIAFLCFCVKQYCQCEGDTSDLAGGEHPDWPVCFHAAHSSAVDPQACPLWPVSLHRSHFT